MLFFRTVLNQPPLPSNFALPHPHPKIVPERLSESFGRALIRINRPLTQLPAGFVDQEKRGHHHNHLALLFFHSYSSLIFPCKLRNSFNANSASSAFGGLPCHSGFHSIKSTPFPGIVWAIMHTGFSKIDCAS